MTEVYPFQPTQISGCRLWLDAADTNTFTLSGSSITQWRDKIISLPLSPLGGTSILAQNVFGSQPAILFNGGYLISASNVFTATENVNNINQFVVMKRTNSTTYGLVAGIGFYTQNTKNSLYINANQAQIVARRGWTTNNTRYDGPLYGNTINQGTIYSALTDYQASTYQLINNGISNAVTAFAGTGTTTSDASLIYIGNNTFNEIYYGYVAEYIIYNTALTTSQRQQIEGYLGWKWGLAKSLPITHPYYNSPPFSLAIPIPLQPSLPLLNYAPPFFTPIQIPGCKLWLDASDPNANGAVPANDSIISTWKDKSGSGNNALLYSTYGGPRIQLNGLNSRPLLLFDSTQMLSVNKSLPLGFIFVVGRDTSFGGSMFSAATSYFGSPFQGTFTSYINVVTNSGNNIISATGTSQNVVYLYSASLIGSTATVFINGTQWATGSTSGTPNTPSSLFISSDSGVPAASDWAECIFYPSISLTNTERQQIEGYLAWKWGLQANLPANHPYKSVSPINITAPLSLSLPVSIQNTSPFFSPLNITGCSLWLDGRDVNGNGIQPQNGASVSIWNDKSGNNRNATQTTSSLQPIYANMSIVFPNLKYLNMADAFNMLSSVGKFYSIFVVEKRRSNKVQNFMVAFGGAAGNLGIAFGYNGDTTFSHTAAYVADTNYTVAGYQNTDPTRIWSGGYNGSIRDLVLNGTTVTTTNPYTYAITSWTQPCIGFLPLVNINQYYVGNIYEILFYNSYLRISVRQKIEGYLAWKWGTQASLPSTHPWVRFPPPPL